jgi:alkylation response protein AidB-like acyl-CoA dehydrogenase
VVVPRDRLVGEIDGGWRVTMGSLAHERAGLWLDWIAALDHVFRTVVELARSRGALDDARVRDQLVVMYEEIAGLRALGYKGFASFAKGGGAPEHSLLKLATSELRKRLAEVALEIDATADTTRDFLGSFAGTIGGGTSEIQRNAIAHHVLGLPRDR